jgi:D-methionine transport system ATP-binding protein
VEPFFTLENVSVHRTGRDGNGRDILCGITLQIPIGARWVVVGRSGAGKSTLLRVLNRFENVSAGRVLLEGAPLESFPPARLRRDVALVFQEPIWLPGTARENLMTPVALGHISREEAESRLGDVLQLCGLDPSLLDRAEDELSVGQRQRVVLGRALMGRPRALLLDEPTSALDPPGARALLEEVRSLTEAHALTALMVTHRLEDARVFGTETVVLDGGRVAEHGPTDEVLGRLQTEWGESSSSRAPRGSGG